jgi:hypothetical protein
LPDGALSEMYLVSMPVVSQPTRSDETFTWLLEVREDGQFLGYMRHPNTYDAQTNALVYELPGQVLQDSALLAVILKPSRVQVFLPDVHGWSSPFASADDFGELGQLWSAYSVLAPQVGGRIGIRSPDSGDMIWVDASGVGPVGRGVPDRPLAPGSDFDTSVEARSVASVAWSGR